MSEVTELIDEAKQRLAAIEAAIHKFAHVHPDATQLRIAAARLGLFAEQHAQAIANAAEPAEAPQTAEQPAELDALTRTELNAKAQQAGVQAPEKLANKDAVIAAIHAGDATGDPGE